MEEKKLLIISHNIIDTTNNVGKTIISIIKKWPVQNIRSIYLRNEIRNTMLCDDSFMITDGDILNNTFSIKTRKCGRRITPNEKESTQSGDEGAYRFGNKRYPIVSLVRDVLWHKKSWKTVKLKEWLEEKPIDLILFIPNDYTLAFEIADYVKKLSKAPMVTFFTDDSFYYKQKTGLIDSIRRGWLLKEGRRIVNESDGMICASDLMRREYKEIFGKDSIVLGNCVEISKEESKTENSESDVFTFSYIGNLHSNRWKALLEIGKCLDVVNLGATQRECVLNVYSASDLGDEIWDTLRQARSLRLKGAVPPSEVKKIQEKSDALVHIEAFDRKSKLSTRLSMSTKIFEYMSRNVPVFAYGPDDISSIDFLKKGEFACVCTEPDKLQKTLSSFLEDKEYRGDLRGKAYLYAKDNFEENKISEDFINFVKPIIK